MKRQGFRALVKWPGVHGEFLWVILAPYYGELFENTIWLVVRSNPSEKYEFVNWDDDDDSQYIWEHAKTWQPNHQTRQDPGK